MYYKLKSEAKAAASLSRAAARLSEAAARLAAAKEAQAAKARLNEESQSVMEDLSDLRYRVADNLETIRDRWHDTGEAMSKSARKVAKEGLRKGARAVRNLADRLEDMDASSSTVMAEKAGKVKETADRVSQEVAKASRTAENEALEAADRRVAEMDQEIRRREAKESDEVADSK